ncbi:MAG: porin [Sulfuricurvum sp.]|uniref:porin n=1 Tax=Sulfuricurvum sp. TaxID=2025608 RepID=UPI0026398C01|nr:porin [Sulfuricurvum sp.]MDD5158893.1 porin [Sulfuricurvum sp.]
MKLVKMSLAAAVLLGASAFALDNVKVSGDAKLFYGTDDQNPASLFDKGSSYADTALRVGATGDLLKGVSFGVAGTAVSTLGLENNLVSNTWTGAHKAAVEDNGWISELWLATTLGKTTAKVGRMSLDTPLAFSETWSIAANTFDAAVLINQDLPDTTLVGAWVGKSNGVDAANTSASGADRDGIFRDGAVFGTFALKGAYAAAIVNNTFKPLVAQAWYYNVMDVADAYWLQADWDCQLIKGAKVGVQYADMSPKGVGVAVAGSTDDSKAVAVKLAYAVDALNVSAAYSDRNNNGGLKVQNVAASGQSKLYTESYWSYGYVGAADATAWNLTAEYTAKDIAKLGAYYTNVNTDRANKAGDLSEVAVTASKSFGPLDTTLAYINTKANNADSYNTIQAYLTLNF